MNNKCLAEVLSGRLDINAIQEYVTEQGEINVIQELAGLDFLQDGKPSSNNPIYLATYQLAKLRNSVLVKAVAEYN